MTRLTFALAQLFPFPYCLYEYATSSTYKVLH